MKASQITLFLVIALAASTALAGPKILASRVTPTCSSAIPKCSGTMLLGGTNNNGITVTLETKTHDFYNSNGGALKYTIFDVAGSEVTSFICNRPTVSIHSPKLSDGATYTLMISAGSSQSPKYSFDTSSTPCKGTSPKRK